MYAEPIASVKAKEVPATNEAPQFLKAESKPNVPDSSVASGSDRGVSNSVAEVPAPAGPSSDPYKRVQDFFSDVKEDDPEWMKDLRDNMFEMFVDAFRDDELNRLTGKALPQTEYKPLGIGYGPLGGQQFPEACAFELMLGPQGEPVYEPREPRFNENHDNEGKFAGGGAVKLQHQAFEKDGETKVEGDMKTTKYVAPNHSITVEHNTKEGKVTLTHLDREGNMLVKQTHDSVGAARKELQTQGIDHKFYRSLVKPGPMCYRSADGEVTWH
jgi:hypothetical protein